MTAIRRPMRQIGAKRARWDRWQRRNRDLLALRARGTCEACQAKDQKLEAHHVAGRAAEPFCSHVALLAALCPSCHRAVTGVVGGMNVAVRDALAWAAIARALDAFGLPHVGELSRDLAEPLSMLDRLIDRLNQQWEYSETTNAVIRRAA